MLPYSWNFNYFNLINMFELQSVILGIVSHHSMDLTLKYGIL